MLAAWLHWAYCEWQRATLPWGEYVEFARREQLRLDVGRFWPRR